MEGGEGVELKERSNEVVVSILGFQESGSPPISRSTPTRNIESLKSRVQMSTITGSSSPPEITRPSPTPNRPSKVSEESAVTQGRAIARSAYMKPKSRLAEPSYPINAPLVKETGKLITSSSPYRNSPKTSASTPKENAGTAPITPKTPLMASPGGGEDEDEDDEDVYKTANLQLGEKVSKKFKVSVLLEWMTFVGIMVILICSLTIGKLQNDKIWSLRIWKWCVLVLVIFCGRLFTGWFINVLVFLIERHFLLKKKVLYFVYGLKKSVRVSIWLGLVLLAWGLLISRGVKRSKQTTRILNYITRGIACALVGACMWMVKTLAVKLLASSFHVTRFFDRIQESVFHQYVLQTLSGPPLMEYAESVRRSRSSGQLSVKSMKKGKKVEKEEVIDMEKLHRMKQEKISAWTMRGLVKVIQTSGLSTISNALDESIDEEGVEEEITSELEAKAAAFRIFQNVTRPGSKYIFEEDLLRFMRKEEVVDVLPLFEGAAETGKIKKSSLRNWVVNVYNERKALALSLNDTKTAIEELNKILSGIILVVIIIVWILLMGFATTQVLVFISSQLLLVTFTFGNTCKTVFEGLIFVFVMHPFDVGDRCVIDGVQMVVEEVNILTTIFLRYDNEKIIYPNSVLATKAISNYYRSPEQGDSVEFSVDFSTSAESIAALKARVKTYIESKPQHWRPGHSVQVKEIVDVNKLTMGLYVTHTINFQNYGDKSSRRSDLVFELKKIFADLGINYNLLPQEVHLSYVGSAPPTFTADLR
ncbi:mechanosensitive ion channel protein 10-like [Rhododendron vialii]|uniref:mechanosensitive ion channel protein 10-like n=1 Tax=Rhododendron vialii TaxID=182163 RepID=UPI00265E7397|nr:mechanosensitive ion channel protein 10-like [Rhododendron vialii]XP_058206563.1 mechanosensitive ion channel protein 10-like [Rhododendron vialii]